MLRADEPVLHRVRDLREETLRVFRSRVVNPKWLDSIRRHGYKGALEVAATVDYLFGYDATAEVLDDWMYEQLARTYLLDETMQRFFADSNPWAETDIANRLLEASRRNFWQPDTQTLAALQQAGAELEDRLEGIREGQPA